MTARTRTLRIVKNANTRPIFGETPALPGPRATGIVGLLGSYVPRF
jgi:hypothetical protein